MAYQNRLAEAHAICARAVAIAERRGATFDVNRAWFVARLAETTFELGRHEEALGILERAIELLVTQQGRDHPQTQYYRSVRADYKLELGKLDDAQRDLDDLMASYKRRPEPNDRRGATLRGQLYAQLALARGKPAEAERLAREALAELVERKATAEDMRITKQDLGSALVALGRAAEAVPLLEDVVAVAKQTNAREDQLAMSEVELAAAEIAAGKREAGTERARRAKAMLDRWPSTVKARAAVAKLLGQSSSLDRKP
jgi:non-specific serine/threonine protein kinase/serine/threonine-protein kinase